MLLHILPFQLISKFIKSPALLSSFADLLCRGRNKSVVHQISIGSSEVLIKSLFISLLFAESCCILWFRGENALYCRFQYSTDRLWIKNQYDQCGMVLDSKYLFPAGMEVERYYGKELKWLTFSHKESKRNFALSTNWQKRLPKWAAKFLSFQLLYRFFRSIAFRAFARFIMVTSRKNKIS